MRNIDSATRKLLTNPVKRRAWVKYQLHLQGLSLAKIAMNAGVTRQTMYQAFSRTYPRMEKVIADVLDMTPKALWPERYDADGSPIYRLGRPKKSTSKTVENNTSSLKLDGVISITSSKSTPTGD